MSTPDAQRYGMIPLFGTEAQASAVVSDCGTYRYELTRVWSSRPLVGWVMLNPSTADACVDDPTIRRCVSYARSWGFGGIVVRNLYALRTADPSKLDSHPDPIGPHNDDYLARCRDQEMTVLGWGARGGNRARAVLEQLSARGARLFLLAETMSGHPRHPLYLNAGLRPTEVQVPPRVL